MKREEGKIKFYSRTTSIANYTKKVARWKLSIDWATEGERSHEWEPIYVSDRAIIKDG